LGIIFNSNNWVVTVLLPTQLLQLTMYFNLSNHFFINTPLETLQSILTHPRSRQLPTKYFLVYSIPLYPIHQRCFITGCYDGFFPFLFECYKIPLFIKSPSNPKHYSKSIRVLEYFSFSSIKNVCLLH